MTGKRQKVAVYARVSGEEQREAGTIENQLDFARRYCELHRIEIADTYRDDGVTGTVPLDQRPEGRRLLRDAADGKFDAVLVYRVDRLARKTIHLLNAYEQLDALGVGLRSMTESFDTATPAGKFTMTMFASIAALERDTILERTLLGKERKRQQGKWVEGGKPLLGYRVSEEGYLEIEPEDADIVRTIFRLYTEEGMTTTAIANYLNAREVPVAARLKGTHKGNRGIWRPGRVSAILGCSTYMGHYRPLNRRGPEPLFEVPAIVPEETWHKAKALRGRRKALALRNSKRRYLLRGLIRCGHCGLAYVGNSPGGRKYAYYGCMGGRNVNRTLDERCSSASIRADRLEDLVWQDIEGFIRDPGPVILQLEARLKSELAESRPVEDELAELDAEITRKREDRQRVINLYRRGLIDDSDVERELTGVDREVATLNDRRARLLAQAHTIQDLKTQTTTARLLLEQLSDKLTDIAWEGKRELVEALVESITVETLVEDGKRTPKVTIRYRFSGENSEGERTGGGKRISDCSSAPLGPRNPKSLRRKPRTKGSPPAVSLSRGQTPDGNHRQAMQRVCHKPRVPPGHPGVNDATSIDATSGDTRGRHEASDVRWPTSPQVRPPATHAPPA